MIKRFFENARTAAFLSEHSFKHGAVLVKGGKILKAACNKARSVRFAHKFHHAKHGSLHAEIGVILNLDKKTTYGTSIYVVRILKTGEFVMSRPCEMCQLIAQEMGVKEIFFTGIDGQFNEMKLN